MYMQNRNRLTDTENQPMVAKEERGGERGKLGVWNKEIQTTMYKIDRQQGYVV